MTFTPAAALAAAELAKRVYDVANVRASNARALVLRDPPRIAIAGTDGIDDALQDAQFAPHWDSLPEGLSDGMCDLVAMIGGSQGGMRVHRGFLAHYGALAWDLYAMWHANEAAPSDGSCHSLGSAAMVLAILDRPEMFEGRTVHLFGCPTVFNLYGAQEFAKVCSRFGILVFNVQARGDPVCSPLGRVHVGNVVEIGKGWDLSGDHGISHYIADLRAML